MNCPKCGSPISVVSVRAEFQCKHCGKLLVSNLNEFVGTVGIVFFLLILSNSLFFFWVFGFSNFIALLSNIAVAIEISIYYSYLLPRKVKFNEKV
jgi:hypothetical protein